MKIKRSPDREHILINAEDFLSESMMPPKSIVVHSFARVGHIDTDEKNWIFFASTTLYLCENYIQLKTV